MKKTMWENSLGEDCHPTLGSPNTPTLTQDLVFAVAKEGYVDGDVIPMDSRPVSVTM